MTARRASGRSLVLALLLVAGCGDRENTEASRPEWLTDDVVALGIEPPVVPGATPDDRWALPTDSQAVRRRVAVHLTREGLLYYRPSYPRSPLVRVDLGAARRTEVEGALDALQDDLNVSLASLKSRRDDGSSNFVLLIHADRRADSGWLGGILRVAMTPRIGMFDVSFAVVSQSGEPAVPARLDLSPLFPHWDGGPCGSLLEERTIEVRGSWLAAAGATAGHTRLQVGVGPPWPSEAEDPLAEAIVSYDLSDGAGANAVLDALSVDVRARLGHVPTGDRPDSIRIGFAVSPGVPVRDTALVVGRLLPLAGAHLALAISRP